MTAEGRQNLRPLPRIYAGTVEKVDGDELHVVLMLSTKATVYHKSYWRPAQP